MTDFRCSIGCGSSLLIGSMAALAVACSSAPKQRAQPEAPPEQKARIIAWEGSECPAPASSAAAQEKQDKKDKKGKKSTKQESGANNKDPSQEFAGYRVKLLDPEQKTLIDKFLKTDHGCGTQEIVIREFFQGSLADQLAEGKFRGYIAIIAVNKGGLESTPAMLPLNLPEQGGGKSP